MVKPTTTEEQKRKARVAAMGRTVGLRLRIARVAGNFSQSEIARELDITRGRWSQFEKGQRTLSGELAAHVALVTNLDVDFIFLGRIDSERLKPVTLGRLRRAIKQVEQELDKRSPDTFLWNSRWG